MSRIVGLLDNLIYINKFLLFNIIFFILFYILQIQRHRRGSLRVVIIFCSWFCICNFYKSWLLTYHVELQPHNTWFYLTCLKILRFCRQDCLYKTVFEVASNVNYSRFGSLAKAKISIWLNSFYLHVKKTGTGI